MHDLRTPILREMMPGDINDTAELLVEMQAHYRAHCPPREHIVAGLTSRPAGTRLLLALDGGTVVALACFSGIYPGPGLTSGFFLKDLYVTRSHRGSGLGRLLFGHLAAIARNEGIGRIDWTVDANDQRLQQFYETLGGQSIPEKLFMRVSGKTLADLARISLAE